MHRRDPSAAQRLSFGGHDVRRRSEGDSREGLCQPYVIRHPRHGKGFIGSDVPQPKAGERGALEYVLDKLDIEADNDSIETQWVTAKREDGREDVELKDIPIREGLVPNVVGMGAKDAVYLLESVGLRASLNGMGRVSSQSVSPGSRVSKGQTVSLTLK